MNAYEPLLLEVCRVLDQHGGRLSISDLARALGQAPDEVRRQVSAYANVDTDPAIDLEWGSVFLSIEPWDAYSDDPQPSDDDRVCLDAAAEDVLGVEQFDAAVLGPLYQAAENLLAEEPWNDDLADAVALLRQRFLPGVRRRRPVGAKWLAELRQAIDTRRRVRIVYSRAWEPGVTDRVIEPYDLTYTARGAEVDAGPLDQHGNIRTFLVPRVRRLELLDASFVRPDDALARCVAARALTPVTGYVTHEVRWVLDKWSERVDVGPSDERGFMFTAHVLPPVGWRCALMQITAGRALDFDDAVYEQEAQVLAERLWTHHCLDTD